MIPIDAEEIILRMMISSPEAVKQFEDELGYLTERDRHEFAMQIVRRSRVPMKYDKKIMRRAIIAVKIAVLSKEAGAYKEMIENEPDQSRKDMLKESYVNCLKECEKYLDEMDTLGKEEKK